MDQKGELQEASPEAPCSSTKRGLLDNLIASFCFITLKEEILLNNTTG